WWRTKCVPCFSGAERRRHPTWRDEQQEVKQDAGGGHIMSALTIALMAFVCMFGGALLGACLRPLLPGHHVSADSRDVVKLGIGVIATQAALVLGLLVSSAKGSFDTMNLVYDPVRHVWFAHPEERNRDDGHAGVRVIGRGRGIAGPGDEPAAR